MIVGIGLDLSQIARIADVHRRFGQRFLERVFTPGERAYCLRKADPAPSLAGRFAAKEAALKALGTGLSMGIGWKDVEVVRGEYGPPTIAFHGRAAEIARQRGVARAHLTVTHDAGISAAVVVLEDGT